MKSIKFVICLSTLFLSCLSYSQIPTCTADQALHHHLSNTDNLSIYTDMETQIQQWIREPFQSRSDFTLPIVVHVVWNTSDENISDAQIYSQIDILNKAFNNSAMLVDIPASFQPIIANPGITFCLSRRDPQGNPTNGITRTPTSIEAVGTEKVMDGRKRIHYDELGGKDAWDPKRYINIWVGNMENVLGFSSFPNIGDPFEDGLIINPANFGTIGTAKNTQPFHLGKTLIHEMGHYFNLQHIWGQGNGSCDSDDNVEDTPLCAAAYFDCPSYPQSSCGTDDLLYNYMDFSDDACLQFFTNGQSQRILATLNSQRQDLINQVNNCNGLLSANCLLDNIEVLNIFNEGKIYLNNKGTESNVNIIICNVLGQLFYENTLTKDGILGIDSINYPSGVYFVVLNCGESKISYKIVQP